MFLYLKIYRHYTHAAVFSVIYPLLGNVQYLWPGVGAGGSYITRITPVCDNSNINT